MPSIYAAAITHVRQPVLSEPAPNRALLVVSVAISKIYQSRSERRLLYPSADQHCLLSPFDRIISAEELPNHV